ncbi:ComC/BlpC family leader-containing pheromone/bacteriocin [Lactobacillus sp. PSON]|uniref:ComC/BlpC family leader-containing pheromone/bacteriocin n=1 Tax=Lactobacillus sp. PSON TaxID=3455454 RepID=UPI00404351F1
MIDKKYENLNKYQSITNDDLKKVVGGSDLGDLWRNATDWLWGFKNGFEGRKRHPRSWRDRD